MQQRIISTTVNNIFNALQKHNNDVEMTALWLKNACLLHDLLTQHSEQVE